MTKTNATKDPMEAFFTSEAASKGVRLPLQDAMGRETEHWLHIRGGDSEEFKLAEAAANREAVAISGIDDQGVRDKAVLEMSRKLCSMLVMDWSFPKPCTPENVAEFFKQAPQVQRAVDLSANRRTLFITADSTSSLNTQSASSG